MTKEEMQEGNRLIAEFMELEYHPDTKEWTYNHSIDGTSVIWSEDNPPYSSSWNWLMPVVERISKIEYGRYEQDNGIEKYIEIETAYPRTFGMINSRTGNPMFRFNRHPCFESFSLIEVTWVAVVGFIKWYNENNES